MSALVGSAKTKPAPVKAAAQTYTPPMRPEENSRVALVRSRERLAALEQGLVIDKTCLDDEYSQHAERYYHVAQEHALAVSYRDAAKLAITELEAQLDGEVRRAAGQEKITETQVRYKVAGNPLISAATKLYQDWVVLAALWAGLVQSTADRRWAMDGIVKLLQIQYFDAAAKSTGARTFGDHVAEEVRRNGS